MKGRNSMEDIKHIFTEWSNIVALLFGIVGQLLSEEQVTKRFVLNLVWSSILVGVYLMPVLMEYMHIDPTSNLAKSMYALSPMISLQLVALLVAVLPKVLRTRVLHMFGVTDKEMKNYDSCTTDKKN